MAQLQRTEHRGFSNSIALAAILALATIGTAHGVQAGVGQLRVEGTGIAQLILTDAGGRQQTFDQPGPVLTLPAGDYRLHSIRLHGDHYSQSHQIPESLRVTVDPNAPAALRVGAPLRQGVKVERQGPVMVLNYELIGRGGEQYAIGRNQGSPRPAFAVYRGDSQVASGDFEFG